MHIKILVLSFLLSCSIAHAVEEQGKEQIQLQKDVIKYQRYIPQKYSVFKAIQGDLNKDGIKDLVLIVKATDQKQNMVNRFDEKVDRNRRGVIVFINENGQYKKIVQNLSAFSSENEDGGVYFAPELWVEIKNNRLNIHYGHGRYGNWSYLFRLEDQDFRLIGYERSNNRGPRIENDKSINFLTGKKRYRENLIEDDDLEPKFKETWTKANYAPIYLSQIKDMDELYFE